MPRMLSVIAGATGTFSDLALMRVEVFSLVPSLSFQ